MIHCNSMTIEKVESKDYKAISQLGDKLLVNGHHDLTILAILTYPESITNFDVDVNGTLLNVYQKAKNPVDVEITKEDCETIRSYFPQYSILNDTQITMLLKSDFNNEISELIRDEISHTYYKPNKTPISFVYIFIIILFIEC